MKIVILGAGGALATALKDQLTDHKVWAFSKEQVDVTDNEMVIANRIGVDQDRDSKAYSTCRKPDVIINCAAYTDVNGAEKFPTVAWEVNAAGPFNLAYLCRVYDVWLIHVSTDYVFRGAKSYYCENDPTFPVQNYGRTKLAGELAVQTIMQPGTWTIVRTSTLYGPPRRPSFVRTIVRNAVLNERIKVVDGQRSSPTSTDLLARIIAEHIIRKKMTGVVHATSRGDASKFEFAEQIVGALALELDCKVEPRDDDPAEVPARPYTSVLSNDQLDNIDRPNWYNDMRMHFSKHERAWLEYIERCKSELS